MYLAHFALAAPPFSITPDTAFAFASRAQQEALNTLLLAVADGEGFIKITGEVGTGKTLACRRFLATLAQHDARCDSAYIPNPCLTPRTLLLAVAAELKLGLPARASEQTLLGALHRALIDAAGRQRRVVVCLDEAQAMPLDALEALRLLSNLETEKRKLIQIVLFGQPELDRKLDRRDLRQLASRIGFQYRLGALSADETAAYLAHRLRVAGGEPAAALVDARCARLAHLAARGIPRLLNIVAHKSLLLAYGEGRPVVSPRHVRAAAGDTPAARRPGLAARAADWWQAQRAGAGG